MEFWYARNVVIFERHSKLVFVVVFSFGRPLTSQSVRCISLNSEPFVARTRLIDLNTNELPYYEFICNFERCIGMCNTLYSLSVEIYVLNRANHVNVKSV